MDSPSQYPPLPSLSLDTGTLPTIIIDSREQDRLPISPPFNVSREDLATGDYTYKGGEAEFAVERKTIADLIKCLTTDRKRFRKQLDRLRAYRFSRLLVVGKKSDLEAGHYRSRFSEKAAVNGLHAIEARYVPVVWAETPEMAARMVETWCFWHFREMVKAVKRSQK